LLVLGEVRVVVREGHVLLVFEVVGVRLPSFLAGRSFRLLERF
jgi:hypothetical protein